MSDPDEELANNLEAIAGAKENFSEDEQNIIDAWIARLSEASEEEKELVYEYARALYDLCNAEDKILMPPFDNPPPDSPLPPLMSGDKSKGKTDFRIVRMPCSRTQGRRAPGGKGAIPKSKKPPQIDLTDFSTNEFEDLEEMAKAIARSKGQTFPEFVVAISRHTADYGHQLRSSMKAETTSFREYVDHVLSQRIKDLTEVLDVEQNAELQKIKKDIDSWQLELSHCKKRIREIIPNFDMESYKKDKFYLKKIFNVNEGLGLPSEADSFKNWKEETCHRVKWYSNKINELTASRTDSKLKLMSPECNAQLQQRISEVKSGALEFEANEIHKQQKNFQMFNCELAEYRNLKME
ncbi:hypothetical protein RUM43_004507 [Polyplax serrata]|uniref:DUF4485 domain-containing protein n=1 Tax=Polyplax serrata TaxID=468196 RepID=A0AAN8SBT3_POLSC